MGRAPCCDKANVKRGPWSPEEDAKLKDYMEKNGTGGNWISFPQKAGLKRCGKSCRLRWLNYLRPHIKHGEFSDDEDRIICTLFANIGSRWSIIAAQLPGRTDNDIKNYWNTKLKKKLMGTIINPSYNQRKIPSFSSYSNSLPITTPSQSQSFSHIYGDFSTPYYTPFIKPNNVSYINTNDNAHLTSNTYHTSNGPTNPMQFCTGKDNMVMFGGGEPSCSSSDGIISYGNFHEGFISNGGYDIEENNKLFDYGDQISAWGDEKQSSFVDTPQISQIQFDLEEVKEMISSSGCNSSLFFNTEMLVSRQNGFDN